MKIILGTDFSQRAAEAGRVAAVLAARWKDTLAVAHAVGESPGWEVPEAVGTAMRALEAGRLREEVSGFSGGGFPVEEHLLDGSADRALTRLAAGGDTRLIVVSSLGRRPAEWLLGSVSERTAEFSPVSTLVVRSAAPFEAWLRGEKPLKVFVAFDFTETAENALRWLATVLDLAPCELTIGHVDWPPAVRSRLGGEWSSFGRHNPPEVQAVLERSLRERAKDILGRTDFRVRCEPGLGRPDARLLEMAGEEEADLLVTGAHQRRSFERFSHPSISRALLRYAPMSVLAVPLRLQESPARPIWNVRRVLVALDLQEGGGGGVALACGLVPPGGMVRLVHIVPRVDAPNPLLGGSPRALSLTPEEKERIQAGARESLRKMIPAEAETRGLEVDVVVREGSDAARAICQEGERFGADVICVEAHDRPGVSRTLLGSVSREVLQRSRLPVMVVPDAPR